MRTMLISFVLFCALSQLAIAERRVHDSLKYCGSIYECFVPNTCTEDSATIAASKVITVEESSKILVNCEALIRFHLYSNYWAFVSIESLTEATKSIVFNQKSDTGELKSEFSCKQIGAAGKLKMEAKYGPKKNIQETHNMTSQKIYCAFEVKLEKTKTIFEFVTSDLLQFIINDVPSLPARSVLGVVRCNPSKLKHRIEKTDPKRVTKKVMYSPGVYACDDSTIFKMEYRSESSTDYEEIAEVTCVGSKFKVGSTLIDELDDLDIRCTAEAHFFCDYDIKRKGGEDTPKWVPSDWSSKKPSALECPTAKPHLIIVGDRERTIQNAKIECQNYGGSRMWTVDRKMLTKEGPAVYCTNELKCHLLHKIRESSVVNGRLNQADSLPKCYDRGTLYVDGKKVTSSRCDGLTGQFKYTVDGAEHVIDEQTKFLCKYPPVDSQAKNKENTHRILIGVFVALGVCIVTSIVVVVIAFKCVAKSVAEEKQRAEALKKKMDAENKDNWLRYCTTADEKAAHNDANAQVPPQNDADKNAQVMHWNKMITFWQYRSVNALATDDASGGAVPMAEEQKPSFIDLPHGRAPTILSSDTKTQKVTKTKKRPNTEVTMGMSKCHGEFFKNVVKGNTNKRVKKSQKKKQ